MYAHPKDINGYKLKVFKPPRRIDKSGLQQLESDPISIPLFKETYSKLLQAQGSHVVPGKLRTV